MYGFVETWITQALGITDSEPYHLSGDTVCQIVDKETFLNIQKAFAVIYNHSEIGIVPIAIRSNVTGMRILLMNYWVDETVLYSLTDGDIKTANAFVQFMNMPNPRFNYEVMIERLPNVYREVIENPNRPIENFENEEDSIDDIAFTEDFMRSAAEILQQTDNAIIPEAPIQVVTAANIDELERRNTEKAQEKPVVVEDENKKNGIEFIKKIRGLFDRSDMISHPTAKGYEVIVSQEISKRDINELIEFSDTICKNVVFTRYYYSTIYNFMKKQDTVEIYKHTVIFDIQPGQSNNYNNFINAANASTRNRNVYTNAICLGEKVNKHWIVRGSNVNADISEINESGLLQKDKDKQIEEIIKNRSNSPFFKYDCIFKDTHTGIVFAVKQRCIISLLFNHDNECINLFEKCLVEIARRISMSVPYETLLEIDKKYFDELKSNNLEDYMKFAVDSSKNTINELVAQLNVEKERLKKNMDVAMEVAKKVRNLQDTVDAFDMKGFEEKQKEKSRITYLDTLKIKEVSSIYIENESIHVYTKNLYAKDDRSKKWYDIGTFHIIIGMLSSVYDANNTVRIFNTKHLGMGMNSGFQAPHVWEDGHACHGNLVTGMTEAYKNRNLFDLVYQIILFLQSANTSDTAGKYVDSWPEVTEEEALGKIESRDISFVYDKKNEVEEKFDNELTDFLPVNITK